MKQEPQPLTETDWYYEYPTYMLLIHEVRSIKGAHIRTDSIRIPWRKIISSAKRAYKPRRRKIAGKRRD